MKKSKILMPLTGIAAIGAIAPVAVMTSCNQGKTIFSDIYVVNNGLIGTDEITAHEASIRIVATLKDNFVAGHSYKRTIDAATSDSGLLSVDQSTTTVEATTVVAGKRYANDLAINVNSAKISSFTADETITIKAKYEELDDNEKVVATQEVTFTAKAVYGKESFPTITEGDLSGTVNASTKKVTFTGWTSKRKLIGTEPVTATLNLGEQIEITETVNNTTLVVPATQEIALPTAAATAVPFSGSITGTVTAGTTYTYKTTAEWVATIAFTTTSDAYVAKSWTQGINIPKDKTITITVAE